MRKVILKRKSRAQIMVTARAQIRKILPEARMAMTAE
jgi:hypothetical protein